MKPVPNKPLPNGCAVVEKDCTFGGMETDFRRSLGRHVGHVVRIPEIKRWYKPRTNQQNRTVRGYWMPIILLEQGYYPHDAEHVYNEIKMRIGWTEDRVNKLTGEIVKFPRPTANLDTAGYSEFMRLFRAYVEDPDTGLGILLPDPDPSMARI